MVARGVKTIAGGLVLLGALAVPPTASAQGYRYGSYDRQSVAVQCGPGQRAVMEQRSSSRGSRVVARCVGSRRFANSGYERARYGRRRRTTRTGRWCSGRTTMTGRPGARRRSPHW